MTNDPFEDALRASLTEHAREAPDGRLLGERIIHAAERRTATPDRPRRAWRAWALPLVAALAVGGVVAAVIGIENYHSGGGPHDQAARSHPVTLPTGVLPTRAGSDTPTTPDATSATPIDTSALHGVKIIDLTFAKRDVGWALASAECVNGPGRCTALFHTTDGTKWTSTGGEEFNVPGVAAGCATKCVQNIRFANPDVGYAYGPSAFFMTTDGGRSWHQQSGGAIFLESLDQNVIRVTSPHAGCPSWCDVQVERSDIGSKSWAPVKLGNGTLGSFGVQFARGGGGDAYLLFLGHPTGGAAGQETSNLYRSTDDGRTWAHESEPCPQVNGEVDSYTIAGAPKGRVTVLCATRQAPQHWFVATSTDAGANFAAQPGAIPDKRTGPFLVGGQSVSLLTGDPTTVLVTGNDGLARSTDGGNTWHPVSGPTGTVTFVGFESSTVGRAVTTGAHDAIWTTRNGGRTWTEVSFG